LLSFLSFGRINIGNKHLNLPLFISSRIAFSKEYSFSRFIVRLAVAATALSVAAMIVTLAFISGFQTTVSQKVFSFWGHMRVQLYEPDKAIVAEETAIEKNDTVVNLIKQQKEVKTIQPFATKSAILKSKENIEGLLIKGVEKDFDFGNLQRFLKKGRWPQFKDSVYSKELVLSEPTATLMQVTAGDSIDVYFIDPQSSTGTRFRRVLICGTYRTGIEEYDKNFAIGDIALIQRLNNWTPNQIGGYEIFIDDYKKMDTVSAQIRDALPIEWYSRTIKQVQPNIFDWLGIQDTTGVVLIIIITIVAVINLITCLFILVLERTKMIGILKTLGSTDGTIQQVFLYQAARITFAGIGIGLLVGLGICLLQQHFQFIQLDESAYFVSSAPVNIVWWHVVLVCVGTFIVCLLSLFLPVLLVQYVKPVKAIQFK
jgi:lipoprotein-releasing system permease protein